MVNFTSSVQNSSSSGFWLGQRVSGVGWGGVGGVGWGCWGVVGMGCGVGVVEVAGYGGVG